jgi:anti-sigma regulatory factor (Ser/Thr protein kinase)
MYMYTRRLYYPSTRCAVASGRLWPSRALNSQVVIYLRHNPCNPLVCEELIHNIVYHGGASRVFSVRVVVQKR